jgi:hypothetical protein
MRRLIPLSLLLVVTLLFATPLGADGKAFTATNDGRWLLAREEAQVAAIAWVAGIEHLAVGIHLELDPGARALWLLPVRGRVDQVQLNLLRDFPGLRGYDPRRTVMQHIDTSCGILSASQLWTIPFSMVLAGNLLETRVSAAASRLALGATISRFGLRSQVVELGAAAPLTTLLAGLGAPVAATDLVSLAPYADGHHSLVATWIDDQDQAQHTRENANPSSAKTFVNSCHY